MGWTSYRAQKFTKDGKIDRKAECDAYFVEGLNRGNFKVLKSTMKGSVYYAAVQDTVRYAGIDRNGHSVYEPIENGRIWGAVFLTSVEKNDFCYKDMSEFAGPCYYDCPKSILDLLSETDNEYALEWRRKCREQLKKKEDGKTLSALPVGTTIEWKIGEHTYRAYKHPAAYQFKRPFWITNDCKYVQKKHILDNWKVVETV